MDKKIILNLQEEYKNAERVVKGLENYSRYGLLRPLTNMGFIVSRYGGSVTSFYGGSRLFEFTADNIGGNYHLCKYIGIVVKSPISGKPIKRTFSLNDLIQEIENGREPIRLTPHWIDTTSEGGYLVKCQTEELRYFDNFNDAVKFAWEKAKFYCQEGKKSDLAHNYLSQPLDVSKEHWDACAAFSYYRTMDGENECCVYVRKKE